MKKLLTLTIALALMLSAITSCATDRENENTNETTAPENTQNVPEPPKAILADLNDDGKDDKILITVAEDKRSATISITTSNDGKEVWSETISVDSREKGMYYLLAAKDHCPDRLLYFRYSYPSSDKFYIEYEKFKFSTSIFKSLIQGDKVFNIGPDAMMASQNLTLDSILSDINKMILPSFTTEGFLLIDNRGEELVYSTKDNMIAAERLSFTLEDFIK